MYKKIGKDRRANKIKNVKHNHENKQKIQY